MAHLTTEDLTALATQTDGPCLSIYLPMEVAGHEQPQNAIRFKNALADAERQAQEQDVHAELKERFDSLARLITDEEFWRHQQNGLVVFATPDWVDIRRVAHSLPQSARVGSTFFLLPLVPVVQQAGTFYILAVSQKHTRLLEATAGDVAEVPNVDMPESIAKYLPVRQKQFGLASFNVRRPTGQGTGEGSATPHGYPVESDEGELRQFFNDINEGVTAAIDDQDAPLVFAGVEELFPFLKECCTHRGLVGEAILGNPDETDNNRLHEQAWELVEPILNGPVEERLRLLGQGMAGDMATDNLTEVIAAARQGQVDTLFVNQPMLLGHAVGTTPSAETIDNRGRADEAVRHTFAAGGDVFGVDGDRISDHVAAATLRYPLTATAGV